MNIDHNSVKLLTRFRSISDYVILTPDNRFIIIPRDNDSSLLYIEGYHVIKGVTEPSVYELPLNYPRSFSVKLKKYSNFNKSIEEYVRSIEDCFGDSKEVIEFKPSDNHFKFLKRSESITYEYENKKKEPKTIREKSKFLRVWSDNDNKIHFTKVNFKKIGKNMVTAVGKSELILNSEKKVTFQVDIELNVLRKVRTRNVDITVLDNNIVEITGIESGLTYIIRGINCN